MAIPDSVPIMAPMINQAKMAPVTNQAKMSEPVESKSDAHSNKKSFRSLLILFLLFLVVVSDFFANHVISKFGQKTMRGRCPSSWGVVLQGLFLVIGYALLSHLDDQQIL